MATNVKIKWRGNKYSQNVQQAMINAVDRAAMKVHGTTRKALTKVGAFPGQPSAPGDPPHKQTGNLRVHVQAVFANDRLSAKVGPVDELKYARIHELGGKTTRATFPARPYLEPSFQKCLPWIQQEIAKAMKKAGTT